jgi:hypothetical protein
VRQVFFWRGADDDAEKSSRKAIDAAKVRNARSEQLRSTLHLVQMLI